MNLRRNARQLPLRLAAGSFIINSGLLGLYLRTPGMRREGSLRPTEQGIPLSKDVWLAAIGASLVIDDLVGRGSRS
jgi:hypothetical protein